jgi:Na+/H+ antiporter NhaD/arsenite permease-like protein
VEEYLALAIFAGVYGLIVARRRLGVPVWVAMLIGATLMIIAQVVSIEQAFRSVNLEVIAFLFGMFTIVSGLERAGVISRIATKMLSMAKTPSRLLMVFVIGIGGMAAFLVNDTLALIGVPLAAYVASRAGIRPVILLLGLAFGITVGSVMTPIGNPQNLLIAAQSGISTPFLTFLTHLTLPTIVSLVLTFCITKLFYRKELAGSTIILSRIEMTEKVDGYSDPRLAKISIAILLATLGGFVMSEVLMFLGLARFSLGGVAMIGAAAMYSLSSHRVEILRSVNYSVLVFFAAMFVVMSAMWSSGAVSMIFGTILPNPDPEDLVQSANVISAASIGMSQVLSNVPFVTIYNFVMTDSGVTGAHVDQWMMLAAASTIAGNLTILGAASNIIVIEAAEARGIPVFSYFEFFKVGSIVTAVNLAVYYVFIVFL